MLLLRSATIHYTRSANHFPFNLPLVQANPSLQFTQPVTFLVGENGCGKSTLLETIAIAAQATTVGSFSIERDPTLNALRPLARAMKLVWSRRTRQGFFLRAEDFFGFVKRINQIKAGLNADVAQIREEYQHRSEYALGLALLPYTRELSDLEARYGEGLDTMSHGESFLKLFQSRFVAGGLYLLDEPETPLSPVRQLALLSQIKAMVAQQCQFIIATHSPILMAYPDATILHFDAGKIEPTAYDALEHVQLTRDFLNNPEQFLQHL